MFHCTAYTLYDRSKQTLQLNRALFKCFVLCFSAQCTGRTPVGRLSWRSVWFCATLFEWLSLIASQRSSASSENSSALPSQVRVTSHDTLAEIPRTKSLFAFVFVVFFAYLFFSGDLYRYISASEVSDYVDNYTPTLNFYLVPVIVSFLTLNQTNLQQHDDVMLHILTGRRIGCLHHSKCLLRGVYHGCRYNLHVLL